MKRILLLLALSLIVLFSAKAADPATPVIKDSIVGKTIFLWSKLSYAASGDGIQLKYWKISDDYSKQYYNTANDSVAHTFPKDGTYTIILFVKTRAGSSDSLAKVVTIKSASCLADFTTTVDSINRKLVKATSISVVDDPLHDSIINYKWQFSGVNYAGSTPSAKVEFSSYGIFPVCLDIITQAGCTASYCTTIDVSDKYRNTCKAIISSTTANRTVYFRSDSSFCAQKDSIVSRAWNLGDATYASIINPYHKYPTNGNFPVSFAIKTLNGCVDTARMTVIIADTNSTKNCVPSFTYVQDSTNYKRIKLTGSATLDAGDNVKYFNWQFNTYDSIIGLVSPTYTYPASGNYDVCLSIGTKQGCSSTLCKQVSVVLPKDSMELTYVLKRNKATFTYNINYGPGDRFLSGQIGYVPDLGMFLGITNKPSFSYTFKKAGTYPVKYTVTSLLGKTYSQTVTVVIPQDMPTDCAASFTWQKDPLYPNIINFENTSTNIPYDTASYTMTYEATSIYSAFGNQHAYTKDSVYNVCLDMTTTRGCDSRFCTTIPINYFATRCKANITATVQGQTALLSSENSQQLSNDTINTRVWNFGDGNSTTALKSVAHTYATTGTFNASLIVKTKGGCTDTTFYPVVIADTLGYLASFKDSIAGNKVYFDSRASHVPSPDSIISRIWSFGDGGSAGGNSPIINYSYDKPGTYNITLKLHSQSGKVDSTTNTIIVTSPPPSGCKANFTFVSDTLAYNLIKFTNLSTPTSIDTISTTIWRVANNQEIIDSAFNAGSKPFQKLFPKDTTYKVLLTIITDRKCTDTISKLVSIENLNNYFINFTDSLDRNKVYFKDSGSYRKGDSILKVRWEFGDAPVSSHETTGRSVDYVYKKGGSYTVTYKVFYKSGKIDSTFKTIVVPDPPTDCKAGFTFSQSTQDNRTVLFTSTSTSIDPIRLFVWRSSDMLRDTGSLTLNSFSRTFSTDSTYRVSLRITTFYQCVDTISMLVKPRDFTKPYLAFKDSIDGNTIYFDGSETSPAQGDVIQSRYWYTGETNYTPDGNFVGTMGTTAKYSYHTGGTYIIKYKVILSGGKVDSLSRTITIAGALNNCKADFAFTADSVNYKKITFTNLSTSDAKDPIRFNIWKFKDGLYDTVVNMSPYSRIYVNDSTYKLKLEIRTEKECRDTIYKYITIKNPVVISNRSFKDSIDGNKAFFTDTLTNNGVTKRTWLLSETTKTIVGSASVAQSFPRPGNYPVTLIRYLQNGSTDSISKTIVITSLPPTGCKASFTWKQDSVNNRLISFTNVSAPTAVDTIQKTFWDFTGAGIDTAYSMPNPFKKVFAKDSTYRVQLIIQTERFCIDTVSQLVSTVKPKPAYYTAFTDSIDGNKVFIKSDDTYVPATDSIIKRSWTFGDGPGVYTYISPNVTHSYFTPGTYKITFTVTTKKGIIDSVVKFVVITQNPPKNCKADFTYKPTVQNYKEVTFTSTSIITSPVPADSITAAVWTFTRNGNDTGYSSLNKPFVRLFAKDSSYRVYLAVYTDRNCVDTISKLITITPPTNCQAIFTHSLINSEYNKVSFEGKNNIVIPGDSIVSRTWKIGSESYLGTSTAFNYTFKNEGTFNTCLTIKTAYGCSSTYCDTVTIKDPYKGTCHAVFTDSTKGLIANFTNSSYINSGVTDSIIKYTWRFEDLITSTTTGKNASHTYQKAGAYQTCLFIQTQHSCYDTLCKKTVVTEPGNNCSAVLKATQVNSKTLLFNTKDSWSPVNDPIVYKRLDFGDGLMSYSLADTVTKSYRNYGHYTASLRIRTISGCENTMDLPFTLKDTINVADTTLPDPLSIISINPNPAHIQLVATIHNSTTIPVQAEVVIYDLFGVKRFVKNYNLNSGNTITVLPVSHLNAGYYILSISSKYGSSTKRFYKL